MIYFILFTLIYLGIAYLLWRLVRLDIYKPHLTKKEKFVMVLFWPITATSGSYL